MECLKIAKNGQWSLEKKTDLIGSDKSRYMSYKQSPLDGQLPEDHGARGKLHNIGNVRAPRGISNPRMKGKVANPMESAASERKPGTGLN